MKGIYLLLKLYSSDMKFGLIHVSLRLFGSEKIVLTAES